MFKFTEYVDGIGEVKFMRHHSAKRFILRIYPKEGIRVTMPVRASNKAALRFVKQHKSWIEKHAGMIEEEKVFTPDTPYQTREHALDMQPFQRSDILVRIMRGKIIVRYPKLLEARDARVQTAARRGIELALRREAEHLLLPRLHKLSGLTGISYNNVRLKRMKSRWGSCSAQNNINLNVYLAQLPEHLIDYVLLHELTHVWVKNHSAQFWEILNKLTGNKAKALDRELKQYTVDMP